MVTCNQSDGVRCRLQANWAAKRNICLCIATLTGINNYRCRCRCIDVCLRRVALFVTESNGEAHRIQVVIEGPMGRSLKPWWDYWSPHPIVVRLLIADLAAESVSLPAEYGMVETKYCNYIQLWARLPSHRTWGLSNLESDRTATRKKKRFHFLFLKNVFVQHFRDWDSGLGWWRTGTYIVGIGSRYG